MDAKTGRPDTSYLLSETGASRSELPLAEHDLRDTFAADDLLGEAPKSPSKAERPKSSGSRPAVPGGGDVGDAAALFEDEAPAPRARRGGAEARSRTRRCPSCSTVVPAGMSLCSRCGLDLDTGQRHVLDEILDDMPPPPPPSGPPIGIMLVGGLSFAAAAISALMALVASQKPGASQFGYLSLASIGAFGVYASVQFLRGKSIKLMGTALMLGGLIAAIALIAMPIWGAMQPEAVGVAAPSAFEEAQESVQFKSLPEKLAPLMNTIYTGIGLLLLDAAALWYLTTSGARKYFRGGGTGL